MSLYICPFNNYCFTGEFCQFNKETTTCPAPSNMILAGTENPCGSRGVCQSDKLSGTGGFKCVCASGTDTEYCKLSARNFPEGSYIAMQGKYDVVTMSIYLTTLF